MRYFIGGVNKLLAITKTLKQMNNNKNKILKILYDKFQHGEKKSGNGLEVTNLGKSATNIEIHESSNIKVSEIEKLCISMINIGHIILQNKDVDDKANRYLITELGRQAYVDGYYPKLNAEIYWNLTKDVLTILFAAGSLVLGAINYVNQKNSTEEINKLKNEVNALKPK